MAAPLKQVGFHGAARNVVSFALNRFQRQTFHQKRWLHKMDMKKFYKNATLSQVDGWFEVNLDQRKLRTPSGNLFRVPNESLAQAVATEWNAQEGNVKRHSMHLTSLCNMAIDNPGQKSRSDIVRSIIHFLETDTVSFRMTNPEDLFQYQEQHWGPVTRWVENRYQIKVPIYGDMSVAHDLPENTVKTLEGHLHSHSDWALMGYSYAVHTLKSLVLTLALMDRHLTVEDCVKLSRLEEDFQIEKWGNVEWHHDVDLYELRARVAAATLFVHWSCENLTVKRKATFASTTAG